MKLTFWVYLIGALALAGIFPLAGFWAKDEILTESLVLKPYIFWLLFVAAFFTAFYMGRQVLLVFFGEPRSPAAEHARDNPPVMTVPLVVLAILSTVGGGLNLPAIDTLTKWLEQTNEKFSSLGFNLVVAGASTGLALLGLALAWYLYWRRYREMQSLPAAKRPDDPLRAYIGPVFTGMENKWWVDELYRAIILNPYVALSRFLADQVDGRFWHDWFHDIVIAGGYRALTRFLAEPIDLGVIDRIANGLADVTKTLAGRMRRIQSGFVRNYALAVFIGVVIIIGYLVLR
jgi:NADH-quinone oxidoreductase subunit L